MQTVRPSIFRTGQFQSSSFAFVAYSCVAAFSTYCCMYAMRKPFTAGTYTGLEFWGVQFKILLVVSQVLGYAVSKFIGIRLISSMSPGRRSQWLLGLLSVALLALLGFAVTPFPYNALWLFVNGLPLGMIWGIVFSYLEGRKSTEVLAAAISVNFIVSSGFVKSVGKWLIASQGISEFWMPFIAGLIFVPPLLVAVWMLERMPAPSESDKAARNERTPMTASDRRELWARYAPGLLALIGVYLILTIIRDVRDNFAVEIWSELGYSAQPAILTTAELPVAAICLLGLGALITVKNNYTALNLNHWIIFTGSLLLILSTLAFQHHFMAPVIWMVINGIALFIPYIIFNGILFDRLLAAFREPGNVGFLMYVADTIGYLGSVVILLWRNFGFSGLSWLDFYFSLCYIGAALVSIMVLFSAYYFKTKARGIR